MPLQPNLLWFLMRRQGPAAISLSLDECPYSAPALASTIYSGLLLFREKGTTLVGTLKKPFSMWELLKKREMSSDSSGWKV